MPEPSTWHCQVLVVGAGPSGGELARQLAAEGLDVMLVDRLADLSQAAFSSAALPLEALHTYGIPTSVVASTWRGWQLLGPAREPRSWWADRPLGAVLDFAALRQWLAQGAVQAGARLQLGWRAVHWSEGAEGVCTDLQDRQGGRHRVLSTWLVDATGEVRALIGEPPGPAGSLVSGLGVEWLLAVPVERWQAWADRLAFFLGSCWVSQGYGWVFPMQPGQLKVGVCRLQDPALVSEGLPPLGAELARLLGHCGLADAAVLDRHGGRIRSTVSRREPHVRGPLIGLGDAVSTGNLLGGEGIRHAMASARVLAPLLVKACLKPDSGQVARYPRRLRRVLGWRWGLSGRLAQRTWLGLRRGGRGDARLERLLRGLETARAEDLSALLFDYRFERYGLRALPYLLGWC